VISSIFPLLLPSLAALHRLAADLAAGRKQCVYKPVPFLCPAAKVSDNLQLVSHPPLPITSPSPARALHTSPHRRPRPASTSSNDRRAADAGTTHVNAHTHTSACRHTALREHVQHRGPDASPLVGQGQAHEEDGNGGNGGVLTRTKWRRRTLCEPPHADSWIGVVFAAS